jgi:NADH:ubiquinone oxidoreductase subunit 6 (subunit J)
MHRLRGELRAPPIHLRRTSSERKSRAKPSRTIGAVLLEETPPPAAPASLTPRHHVILRPQFYRQGNMPMRRPRPRPTDQPLIWKELHVETALAWRGPAQPLAAILLLCVLMGTGMVFVLAVMAMLANQSPSDFANPWARYVGTTVACVLLLVVAVRAAASFSGERERQTLDSLLSTPLNNRTILNAKWLGSVLSVRKGWWALVAIWGLGVLSIGVHPLAFPLLICAYAAYAHFLAGVGIWFSLASRTTLRATIWTLLVAAGVNLLPWAVELGWDLLAYVFEFRQNAWNDLTPLVTSPPVTLSYLASFPGDWGPRRWPTEYSPTERLAAALLGIVVYAVAAWVLWRLINARFGKMTGRMPVSGKLQRAT